MKYVTTSIKFFKKAAVLSIFRKFLEKISDRAHIQHSYEISIWALS